MQNFILIINIILKKNTLKFIILLPFFIQGKTFNLFIRKVITSALFSDGKERSTQRKTFLFYQKFSLVFFIVFMCAQRTECQSLPFFLPSFSIHYTKTKSLTSTHRKCFAENIYTKSTILFSYSQNFFYS